jgi:hypothetical protein
MPLRRLLADRFSHRIESFGRKSITPNGSVFTPQLAATIDVFP